jgi:hypothetical protein
MKVSGSGLREKGDNLQLSKNESLLKMARHLCPDALTTHANQPRFVEPSENKEVKNGWTEERSMETPESPARN